MTAKDANLVLKDEIAESSLRLKAAKYGHRLEEIVPSYENSFYLPDKTMYFEKNMNHRNKNGKTFNSFVDNPYKQ
jgi:hypothetical protein